MRLRESLLYECVSENSCLSFCFACVFFVLERERVRVREREGKKETHTTGCSFVLCE